MLAWIVNNVLNHLGGYTVNRVPFYLVSWHNLHYNLPAGWKVLTVFGANYAGLGGVWLVLAFLHLVSVLLVASALALVAWRFFGVSLVDEVLAVAIVLNVALFLLTDASNEAAMEVAVIGRVRRGAGGALDRRGPDPPEPPAHGGLAAPPYPPAPGGPALPPGSWCWPATPPGSDTSSTSPPPRLLNTSLAPWLLDHHLTYGLSGYWTSSSVTVGSGERVQVRALMQYTMKRDLWMSNVAWYNPRLHYANFIVLDSKPGFDEPPGAAGPDQQVLRPPHPDLSHRALHRTGLEPEPAHQHPAAGSGFT